MQTFILRRLLIGVVILFILSVTVFWLLRVVPGDPAIRKCGLNCTEEQIEQIREDLGLNKSYPEQYWDWMGGVLTGDLGTSTVNQRPVSESIRLRLPVTLELMVLTLAMTIIVGIPFGVISAIWRNSPADYGVRVTAIFGLSAGLHGALSGALGGLIGVVAGVAFTALGALAEGKTAGIALLAMLRAEAVKIGLMVLLLGLVLTTYTGVVVLGLITSFLASALIFSMAAFVRDN